MKKIIVAALICAFTILSAQAQVKVICHRGFWQTEGSAQNSIASITKADSIGAFGSELDVWMTADGRLVVDHDKTFKGVNMETGTYEQIRAIRLDNGEQLPSLEEYLQCARKLNTRIILELKSLTDLSREDEAARKVAECLRIYNLLDRTDIICFSINACLAFRKYLPQTRVYYLDGDLTPKKLKNLGMAGLDYEQGVLRAHPEWIKEAHDLGLEVNVWTVDKKEDLEFFIRQGVDYITTNQPVLLQSLIK